MPAKKHALSDEDRAKRIREIARELGTNNDPKAFDKAFEQVAQRGKQPTEEPKIPKD